MREHEKKYADYVENPSAGDNKGHLAAAYNAGNMERYTQIFNARLEVLWYQIINFRNLLAKCEREHGKK
ncbi:hypothetical protein [Undibacterium terreum]|uniref:Uncharacterized protein n=1 Tax=Undibacterium terreum TaxID=1224302 RepID=A0A916UQV8_9BURK|nr:hypothetical protein [Undibacterium terreum]GGC83403.1 hypothetical protein GCM10011396_33520 [Undibacterium terreum]